MIKNIIETLQYAKGETENIRMAQGYYSLPKTMKGGLKLLKKTIRNGNNEGV